ncbi:PilZ domain-containing protein [Hahella ganghwensis]|uniref:PilZ domain-containing protein n=1 Tax=Hahella ganghwensis TaxID=286420 RepID=UPI00037DDA6D|nr:PilZ domain-containing protein [Hahella ganghwensis]
MSSQQDRRRFERLRTSMNVILDHPSSGRYVVKATDLSEGGVFIEDPSLSSAKVGDRVSLRVNGLLASSPEVFLEVVRQTQEGVGLKFY